MHVRTDLLVVSTAVVGLTLTVSDFASQFWTYGNIISVSQLRVQRRPGIRLGEVTDKVRL